MLEGIAVAEVACDAAAGYSTRIREARQAGIRGDIPLACHIQGQAGLPGREICMDASQGRRVLQDLVEGQIPDIDPPRRR